MQPWLLSHLHRVFDRDPAAALAMRVRSPGGLRWAVAADVLRVERPDLPDLEVPLDGATIGEVRAALSAAGVGIVYADPALDGVGALALLPGSGDQDTGDGDHLLAYTSILWGWTDAVGRTLDRAKADIGEALRQLVIPDSRGEWADLWASYFGLRRRNGESDARLAERIVWEPRRPRSNPTAMRANIRRLTGLDVEVREPWRELFTIGVSEPSGGDHLPDDKEFGYHRIQLVARRSIDFTAPMREAEADRPAGTLLLPPAIHLPPILVRAVEGGAVAFGGHDTFSWHLHDFDGQILDYNFVLGDSFVKMNPRLAITALFSGHVLGPPDPADIARHLTFCKGEIILSDQGAIGEEQAHLPGRVLVEIGEAPVLSDSGRLSDYEWGVRYEPIDEWTAVTEGAAPAPYVYPDHEPASLHVTFSTAVSKEAAAGAIASRDVHRLTTPKIYRDTRWAGRWEKRRWSDRSYPIPQIGFKASEVPPVIRIDSQGNKLVTETGGYVRI
ncbi:hypothetical protein [Azospirillum sp. TSO22-1]|uniref:hypothetical protein n=1 Tax=Azospirillum sp. TSO22-1 TaxID=716789 RepID=UPI000D611459|nr:hypothetical protein [Azospirillum sp. TSO22-1]PWC44268.1 hypothetical protein TSO221_18415 [Azospirillum sp. TSO22-1]